MAITISAPARVIPTDQLLLRVMSEFDEMPSLRLTMPQAMRLWGLDRPMCDSVIDALINAHFLERDRRGQFAKMHASY